MKKASGVFVAAIGIVFLTLIMINHSSAQSSQQSNTVMTLGKTIPSGVMDIAESSCVKCHAEDGNSKAMRRLDLSNWSKYSPKKQAKKANSMCNMVSKGKMPPENFLKKNPGTAVTKEQEKIICDWAASIRTTK